MIVDCPACEELCIFFIVNADRIHDAISVDGIYCQPDKDHTLVVVKDNDQLNFIACSSDTNVASVHPVSVEQFTELVNNDLN